MSTLQHGLTRFTCSTHHDQFVACFIEKVNMGMIVIERTFYLFYNFYGKLFLV